MNDRLASERGIDRCYSLVDDDDADSAGISSGIIFSPNSSSILSLALTTYRNEKNVERIKRRERKTASHCRHL